MALLQKALRRASGRAGGGVEHALHYPLYPPPRVAVLGLEARGPRGVHSFPQWTAEDLRRLRPQALAGWWNDLAEAARLVLAGELELPCLQYPVVVFVRPESAPLPARCHDRLWEWFGAPTIEQIRMPDGELLAYECEARDGYHAVSAEAAERLGLVRSALPCPCGSPLPVWRAPALKGAAGAG